MPSFKPVIAVARSLQILQTLNTAGRASINDLHKATGLHRSTILRMLETLMHEGYVVRLENVAQYAVTGKCLLLSLGFDAHESLIRTAEPLLATFRPLAAWPVDIAVYDHDAMVILKTTRSVVQPFITRYAGHRISILLSALGRAYFSHVSENIQLDILGRIQLSEEPFNAGEIDLSRVAHVVETTRTHGYAVPDPEYLQQVYHGEATGFALPIFDVSGVVAAISVMVPTQVMSLEDASQSLLPQLRELAQKISHALLREASPASLPTVLSV
jgi:IclR family mhp operon transcriptional activator